MIVMFQGVHNSYNGVTEACCIAAVMSATKYNRKTLLVQLTGSSALDAEKFLIGKDLADEEAIQTEVNEIYRIDDRGIDALIRRAGTAKLTKDHFDSSCRPLLQYENMLDCAGKTKSYDFLENLTVKEVRTLIKHAGDVYDNIFLLLDGKNQLIMQELLELCDVYITCLQQSPQISTFNQFEGKRSIFLVPGYDNTSVYNALYLKKKYAAKKIYTIGHNTGFNDSCLEGTMLRFMLKNVNNTSGDDNYGFIKGITTFMEAIMDKEDWSTEIPEAEALDLEDMEREEEPKELSEVPEGAVITETKMVRKGLFGRKNKRVVTVKIDGSGSMAVKEDLPEELEEENGNVALEEEIKDAADDLSSITGTGISDSESNSLGTSVPEGFFQGTTGQRPESAPIKPLSMQLTGIQRASMAAAKIHPEQNHASNEWSCPNCGAKNTGNFCGDCGCKKQMSVPASDGWTCPACGIHNTSMFCSNCGTQR